MFLVGLWMEYPDEVRADLQRYFGLNIEHMGTEFSCWQAAACLRCLPLGSALLAKVNPAAQYTRAELYLHGLLDAAAGKHLPFPWENDETREKIADFEAVPADEFDEWLSQTTWEEVDKWHQA